MKTEQFRLEESQPQKLTKWANEPSLQILKQDLEAAKPSHTAQLA